MTDNNFDVFEVYIPTPLNKQQHIQHQMKVQNINIFHYCASSTFYTFTSYCTYHRQYSPPWRKHGICLHQDTAPEQKTAALRL